MWLVWLCASTFLSGYLVGQIVSLIKAERAFRRERAAIREKQAEIRRLMDERKSLRWQNRIGRAL